MGLVDYSSDSSDSDEEPVVKRQRTEPSAPTTTAGPKTTAKANPAQGRRLPRLPSAFAGPRDDPTAHQGRARTRAFVDGDFYAHVYVELAINTAQRRHIDAMLCAARESVPGIEVHSFLDRTTPSTTPIPPPRSPTPPARMAPLHISLTHPLPLRADVARTFSASVAAALRKSTPSPAPSPSPISISLSTPKIYHNTATPRRAFLALRLGAGPRELEGILALIRPLLSRHRVEAYFDVPEWHASFGWCLDQAEDGAEMTDRGGEAGSGGGVDEGRKAGNGGAADTSPFPSSLLTELERLMPPLRREAWSVAEVCVKVGKDVLRIPLG